jgi:hypothetical protein
MTALPESAIHTVYKHWLSAATSLLACQWQLFEAQYQAGLKIMEAALGAPSGRAEHVPVPAGPNPVVAPAIDGEVQRLERLAAERISHGLAPPREVYQAPYRDRINWEQFPQWARPSDPEAFDGSSHEG